MWLVIAILFLVYTNYIERKNYRFPVITPMNLLCLPTLVLMLFSYPLEKYVGYLAVSQKAVSFFVYCIFFFWVGGLLCLKVETKRSVSLYRKEFNTHAVPTTLLIIICGIFLLILIANLNQILGNRTLFQIEDQEFAQNGIVGHVGELIVFFIIYYIGSFKEESFKTNKIIAITLLVILIGLKILMSVKAQAVIPFVAGFLFLIMRGYIKLQAKSLIIGAVSVFALFTIPAVLFNTEDDSIDYVMSYFLWYLYAGISGLTGFLNENPIINYGECPEILIRFFQNVYHTILHDGIIVKSGTIGGYAAIYTDKAAFPHNSNVQMLFGEVLMNAGFFITAIYFIIVGYISHVIFLRYKRHLMLTILYAYWGAGLVMSFFSSYILGQPFYEMCFFTYILYLIAKNSKLDKKLLKSA